MDYTVHGVLRLRGLQPACQHELSTFHLLQGQWRWGLWTMFLFDWKWLELVGKRQSLWEKANSVHGWEQVDITNLAHSKHSKWIRFAHQSLTRSTKTPKHLHGLNFKNIIFLTIWSWWFALLPSDNELLGLNLDNMWFKSRWTEVELILIQNQDHTVPGFLSFSSCKQSLSTLPPDNTTSSL